MKKNRSFLGFGLLTLVCILSFIPANVSGALVWSEYFNELDFDTWTMQSCQLIDNELHGINGDHISAVMAYRESTISTGTWKFDLTEIGEWGEELDICKIFFMSPLELEVPNWEYYALSIVHASGSGGERLSYTIEKYVNNLPKILIATHLGEWQGTTKGTHHHFAITRVDSGLMTVFLNGTQIMQVTDTELTTTGWFGFYTWDDWSLDNVEVYNTIEIGGTLPLVTIGVVGAAVIGIIVVSIYFVRFRK
ncbi:MAG: hypothetical protein E4H14_05410 [Candidatus Thorarchaeota archaeon]|nr:MAG: hypothetical protein E4H14_05410 [Candidatus Thorarchaeota archaeon]